jgi:hypothetical protein
VRAGVLVVVLACGTHGPTSPATATVEAEPGGPSMLEVISSPAGIDCAKGKPECMAEFPIGTSITMSAMEIGSGAKVCIAVGVVCPDGSRPMTCTFTLTTDVIVSGWCAEGVH